MGSRDEKPEAAGSSGGGGFFSALRSWGTVMQKSVNGTVDYEGLEVINPEGGTEDAEAEAHKGRWKQEERDNYWKMMNKYIGADVTSLVTLPVIIFEPMTMLQKMAENLLLILMIDKKLNFLTCSCFRTVDYEGLEVINPEGGTEDAEAEAHKGRWKQEERDNYWKMMNKYIGADVTSLVTLPVIIFEPMTMLQKMAELMEYCHLLDLADECEDPYMRLVYSSSWAISVYFAYQRTWKPFNPILGETYELTNHGGITFISEQLSHHPPISAGHAENEHFTYDITSKVKTKFLGNSVEIYPLGRTRVTLKKAGIVLDLVPPPTKVNNIIFGRTWIDSPGEMVMTNLTTKDKVVLYFQPCGWFGAGRYEVDGYVYNSEEEPKILMTGKWNESMSYQPCDGEGEPLPGTELKEVWRVAPSPEHDKFQYTYFAHKINSFETAPKNLLASDSRLRSDRYALEKGDVSKSGAEKSRLEEKQRAEKKQREEAGGQFTPKWFNSTGEIAPTPWGDLEVYEYNGKYAEHRAKVDSSDSIEEVGIDSLEFNPWQYSDLST